MQLLHFFCKIPICVYKHVSLTIICILKIVPQKVHKFATSNLNLETKLLSNMHYNTVDI